jgi:hypothetical protein
MEYIYNVTITEYKELFEALQISFQFNPDMYADSVQVFVVFKHMVIQRKTFTSNSDVSFTFRISRIDIHMTEILHKHGLDAPGRTAQ